jgi:hypothetical protein
MSDPKKGDAGLTGRCLQSLPCARFPDARLGPKPRPGAGLQEALRAGPRLRHPLC